MVFVKNILREVIFLENVFYKKHFTAFTAITKSHNIYIILNSKLRKFPDQVLEVSKLSACKGPIATHLGLARTPLDPIRTLSGLARDPGRTRPRPNMDIFVI